MTASAISAAPRKSSTSSTRPAPSASHPAFAAKPSAAGFFAPAVQPKLEVNKPGDKFEQEADAMAESVMRMPSPVASLGGASAVQRKGGDGIPYVGPGAESAIRSKATGGEPLSSEVRSTMEPRFGADFGSVRVHNDSESAALNQGLGARAFTYQNHIFFSRDQYQPGGSEGRRLLAHELTHTLQQGAAVQTKADAAHAAARKEAVTSSEVAEIVSGVFSPSQKVRDEIEAQGGKGLEVRVAVKGLTGEGRVKVRASRDKRYHSITKGSMPLLNPWLQQIGGMYLNFSVDKDEIRHGYASLTPGGGDANDWLQTLQKNADLLGGLGLKVNNLPKPVNEYANGKFTLGVKDLKVEVGGFLNANFNLLLEDAGAPKIDATGDVNIKGLVKGQLNLNNAQGRLAGQVSLGVDYKEFSGLAIIKLNPDGSVDVGGRASYNKNKLSGEVQFVSTDSESANKFARDAIAAAGGKENVQESTAPPPPVPAPKPGKKERALAATGLLAFNLTEWFAGTVNVVVDGKGNLTVVGKIAPPAEIRLFEEKPFDKELIKFEAKAYYGIPVVGNLNLFANISLHALARLGPAKIYQIEILGTYSTDPEIQKNIQIAGSINVSAYAGLRLRAEGGAGVEILDHDLKFGIGLQADVGVKAYADARPTVGWRDPGVFYISGTLELVAQPMLGLGGDFFIALETPWWSPLSDDRWTWPLFSKEWPLTDPIGINASLKEYVFGSGKVPEIELKPPQFDPSKFMTSMVDKTLPDKAGGQGAGHGTFKEDGTVHKPEIPPKKPAPKKADAKPAKKGAPLKGGKSAAPDAKAAKDKDSGKILQNAAKPLAALKGRAAMTRSELNQELAKIKAQVSGIDFNVQVKGDKWSVTPKAGGKAGKEIQLAAKDPGKQEKKNGRTDQKKKEDLDKAMAEATKLEQAPKTTEEQIRKGLLPIKKKYDMTALDLVVDKQNGSRETVHVRGEINPTDVTKQVEIDKAWANSKSSVPQYGALESGFGSSVSIARLTKDHPKGSGPSAEGGHWNTLRQRKDGGSTYYVRGHLLNDNLGGSGGEWRNLSPLTQATNNRSAVSMLYTFENTVKAAVAASDTVEFHVSMAYGRASRAADAAVALGTEPANEGKIISEIILAEQHVPTSVKGVAKKIGPDNTSTELASSTTINSLDTNLDHYAISATPRRTMNLNSASVADLKSLNGVDDAVAKRIVALRPIKDRDDLLKRLNDDRIWHAMVSTAGFRVRFK